MRLLLPIIMLVSLQAFAHAQTGRETVITGTIVRSHDRLPPIEVRGIVTEIHFRFILTGKNHVEEHWSHVALRNDANPNLNLHGPDSNRDTSLGETGSNVSWRVQGTHSLQRIGAGKQYITIINIDVDKSNNCVIRVKFLLQKGRTYVVDRRDDNGEDARFTLPHLVSASCSIE